MQLVATDAPPSSTARWNLTTLLVLGAGLVVVAVSLMRLFDVTLINPDTVQLISAARHLAAGDGLVTSIVYYESQLEFARTPAPLTVWPPGFAVMLAAAIKLGFTPEAAAFAISLLSHLLVSILLYVGVRRLAIPAVIAGGAALVWAVHPGGWSMVLSAYTEPLFTALTLGSCFALLGASNAETSTRWLIGAGLLAAFAILVRYSGVLWPMAVGVWFLLNAFRTRSWSPIGRAVMFGLAPAFATLALFVRNYALTQRLSGGQFDYGGAAGWGDALRRLYWEAGSVLGALVSSHAVVLIAVALTIAGAVAALLRRECGAGRRADLLVLASTYIAGLGAFLLLNAVTSSAGFLDYRYWLPAVPFFLCALAVVAYDAVTRLQGGALRIRFAYMAVVAAAVITALSASVELAVRWPIAPVHSATAVIERALAQTLRDGRTLQQALTQRRDLEHPLLAHHEHRFALATGRAAVGLPDARFSTTMWTTQAVASIVREQKVQEVIFFPPAYDPEAGNNANTPFFHELHAGHAPAWLTPWFVTEAVAVYRVESDRL